MKEISHLVTILAFLLVGMSSTLAYETVTPPDSVTNIIDKAASTILIEEGKTLYMDGKVKDALIKFRQAAVKDGNSWKAVYWVSQCHHKMNNFGYALKYANEAMKLGGDKVNDEVYYILGVVHHRLNNIDSAMMNYKKALETLPKRRSNELLVQHHIDECEFTKAQTESSEKFERKRLRGDINSGYDDYNVVLAGDDMIYFTSRRSNTTGGNMNPDDQSFFEDVYRTTWNKEGYEWDDVTNDLGKINSVGFDALNHISPDGLTGVMTLNTTATDMKKTTRGSDLYEVKLNSKGKWNTPKAIKNKSINTSFFEGSATLTADGNTMYFVSDRKGDKSSTDIYVVEKNGKKWGEAKPLPMTVNTGGRETTPHISADGRYLFFSSDGHTGMGGLDVYVVENKGGEWGEPINLGPGVNTVNNDTHFVMNEKNKLAYVSGFEIIGNKSSIDIYQLNMKNFKFPE